MNLDYPTWLNEEFLEEVLRFSEKDESLRVTTMHLSPATKLGDNYSSIIFRAKVEFEGTNRNTASKSLIVKVKPELDPGLQMMNIDELFEAESAMVMDTLVKMNQLLSDEPEALSAKAFYSRSSDPVTLVLEDLMPLGFRMTNNGTQLDFDHAVLAIRTLAKFHASSFALGEKDPSAIMKYTKGFYHADQRPEFWKYFRDTFKCIAKNISSLPVLGPGYAEKVLNLVPVVEKKSIDLAASKRGEFSVLCHGDVWSNNMLFRYDDNDKPIANIFVDFQTPIYTSPAYDIISFFETSLSNDNYRRKLLIEYQATLKSTMSRLDCQTPAPTLEELRKAMRDRGFLKVVMTLLILPIVLGRDEEVKRLDDPDIYADDLDLAILRSKVFLDILERRMPHFDGLGLLDVGAE